MDEETQEAILAVARSIQRLGNADASTPMGAIEAFSVAFERGCSEIASAIRNLAEAIREN